MSKTKGKSKVVAKEQDIKGKSEQEVEEDNSKFNEMMEQPKLDKNVIATLQQMKKGKPEKDEDEKSKVSINFGVIGLGQAGSRIAETFSDFGYDVCVLNTAEQDLEYIDLPDSKKLFLPFSLGGAGKDLDNGRQAVEQNAEKIMDFVSTKFDNSEMLILAISGGGGTGSGGAESLVGLLKSLGKPLGVIFILPMESEDSLSKHNTIVTLGKLSQMAATDVITSLMVTDNAKVELIYPGLSKADFWPTANKAMVEPLHLFNNLSATPTKYDSLDSMDFGRILTAGDCTIFGMMEVENYLEETAIAEAVINNLEESLLASDFSLKETRFGGFIITGNEKALKNLPAVNINYASHMIGEVCESAQLVSGVYESPTEEDKIKVYTMFSGLGLPATRINILKAQAKEQMDKIKIKEDGRVDKMTIDYEANQTQTKAQEIHKRIKQKNSAFGKLTTNAQSNKIVDRRKR